MVNTTRAPGTPGSGGTVGSAGPALRADAARNRERVLEAAAQVFAERGLDATLNDVAERAGLGVGTVYRRFPNKESLVEALFADRIDELMALAVEAVGHPDPWEGFVYFLERSLARQVIDRGLRDVLLHSGFGSHHVAEARDRLTPMVTELIERAQAGGHLRGDLVAMDVLMLVKMVGSVADYVGDDAPELWRRYLALLLDGLVTDRSSISSLGKPPSPETVERAMLRRE
jgi:AcrR family transcriptional regulator